MFALLCFVLPFVAAQTGLTAQPFQLINNQNVNNAKLSWNINNNADSFNVQRKVGSGSFSTIATVTGDTYDDYNLSVGDTYSYQVTSSQGTSNEASVYTFTPGSGYSIVNNSDVESYSLQSSIVSGGVYYQYNYITNSDGSFFIQEQTSSNGYQFSGGRTVMTSATICASVANASCHLERQSFQQHPGTGEVVMWAHLENNVNYDLAQVACAAGPPGGTWEFYGTYRPLGYDSRDMTFFVDNNSANTGYIISAVGTNTNMTIIQLTSNWTACESLANLVYVNQYREAPSMVKISGVYYLFTSRAAGWYPSQPLYISSTSITGEWSAAQAPADSSTYASQSGTLTAIGNSYAMLSNVWGANWSPVDGSNRDLMLPASFSSSGSGFSYYKYYAQTAYRTSGSSDGSNADVYGIQSGQILSIGKTVTPSPSGGTGLSYVNDGVYDNANAYFVPSGYPFTLEVDLGESYTITQVDLTTYMVQGSETYYQFTIYGSTDGQNYDTIADEEGNTAVGFVPVVTGSQGPYRYIRTNVDQIINTHNGNSATYFGGVIEYTVYGY